MSFTPPSLPSQLRDLIICPDERGVVNYVQDQSIMERDITDPSSVSLILSLSLLFAYSSPFSDRFYAEKKSKKRVDMSERRDFSLVCIAWFGR